VPAPPAATALPHIRVQVDTTKVAVRALAVVPPTRKNVLRAPMVQRHTCVAVGNTKQAQFAVVVVPPTRKVVPPAARVDHRTRVQVENTKVEVRAVVLAPPTHKDAVHALVDRHTPVVVVATALVTLAVVLVPPTHKAAPPAATVDHRTSVEVEITKVGLRAAVAVRPIHKVVQLVKKENIKRRVRSRAPRVHIARQEEILSVQRPAVLFVPLENIKSKVLLLPCSANFVKLVTNSSAKQQHVLSVQSTSIKSKVHKHLFRAKHAKQLNIKINWVKPAAKTTDVRAPLEQQLPVLVVLRMALKFAVDVPRVKYFNQVTV